jgi:hypothetical protein
LGHSADTGSKMEQVSTIREFVNKCSGLKSRVSDEHAIQILQNTDGKTISFEIADLEEVIPRVDGEGHAFLQVNFLNGKKILLTQNLIGFKPAPSTGLDLNKLPKVVTTPDLLSVVEAIEDSLNTAAENEEVAVLRRVFDSVLRGAEAVGFDLTAERLWMQRLGQNTNKASA